MLQRLQSHQGVPVSGQIVSMYYQISLQNIPADAHGAALTYRRSGHSLETRVSTQSLHASLSLVSSNSLLSADSSGALQHTGTIHCCSRSEMIMAVLFSLPCGTHSGTSGSSGTNGTSGTSWALKMIK